MSKILQDVDRALNIIDTDWNLKIQLNLNDQALKTVLYIGYLVGIESNMHLIQTLEDTEDLANEHSERVLEVVNQIKSNCEFIKKE